MKEFEKNIVSIIAGEVSSYLINNDPKVPYWKGENGNWNDMVGFRSGISIKIEKSKRKIEKNEQYKAILNWGGIRGFKSYDIIPLSIIKIEKDIVEVDTYSRISSMSKIFSFYKPSQYFILDSRVSLVINTILVKNKIKNNFIHFPPYRAAGKFVKIGLEKYKSVPTQFSNMGETYIAYNKLILDVFKKIGKLPNGYINKPEIVEMVLFTMVDSISNKK
jgi:hypothetical protein